ncbi:Otoferlin, partial [Araneus ventricosus]
MRSHRINKQVLAPGR